MIAPRLHGGPDASGVPRHDFSTNSHAGGPCPAALDAVRQADAAHYPDASYAALRGRLAAFHGVGADRVMMAGSASEFIFRISALAGQRAAPTLADGDRLQALAWFPRHAYGDYAQAAAAHALVPTDDAGAAALRWACEPASPLGGAQAGLAAMVDAQRPGQLTVLDAAYEPLRLQGEGSLSPAQRDLVWQLWTPNKAMGLTGVRAAYAIAPLDDDGTRHALERLGASWPVGAHGVALLAAWTTDEAQRWLAASLPLLRDWKARQIALCESLGWHCLPSDANFFCARPTLPPGMAWPDALARLRANGIKLRDTASFGLPGHVRLGVLPPEAQDALHGAWLRLADPGAFPLETTA